MLNTKCKDTDHSSLKTSTTTISLAPATQPTSGTLPPSSKESSQRTETHPNAIQVSSSSIPSQETMHVSPSSRINITSHTYANVSLSSSVSKKDPMTQQNTMTIAPPATLNNPHSTSSLADRATSAPINSQDVRLLMKSSTPGSRADRKTNVKSVREMSMRFQ